MLAQDKQEKIKKFFLALERVSHPPGELYDLGLIVADAIEADDLRGLISQPAGVEIFNLSAEIHPDDFLQATIKAFQNKEWLFVKLVDGYLPSKIYNQLRLLAIDNRLQIFGAGVEDKITETKLPKESRIVFIASQASLSKIDNPNFMKLFGPIIKI